MRGTKVLGLAAVLCIILSFPAYCLGQDESEKATKGRDILFEAKGLPYGFEASLPEIHGFLSGHFYDAGEDVDGYYANTGSDSVGGGDSTFLPHSFYVDLISELSPKWFIEGEFEMYHGSSFKVGAGRVVYHPLPEFVLSIGRQFVFLGSQELVYYPTAKYRFFALQPYVYGTFLRFTGWWDSGIAASGRVRLGEGDAFFEYGVMVSNGPGDYRKASGYSGTMNTQGYVFESFNRNVRQSYDNNNNKPVSWRVGFSPLDGLLVRVEGMQGNYDDIGEDDFSYLTSEIFYSSGRFDSMIGAAQLEFDAPLVRETAGIWPDGEVRQQALYAVAGYKIIDKNYGINFLQPVIRYDWIDPNVDSPSSVSQFDHYGERYALNYGINFSPVEHLMFRVAYRTQYESHGIELDGNALTGEVVADF